MNRALERLLAAGDPDDHVDQLVDTDPLELRDLALGLLDLLERMTPATPEPQVYEDSFRKEPKMSGDSEKLANWMANVERMQKLVVTIQRFEEGVSLVVDAEALMSSPHDVRYWLLDPGDTPGTWSHFPSGELNHPLGGQLWSIAACYDKRVSALLDPPEEATE